MSSLWTDMLFLHGYISDLEWARRLTVAPIQPSPDTKKSYRTGALRDLFSAKLGRLCLGIGDGNVRTQ